MRVTQESSKTNKQISYITQQALDLNSGISAPKHTKHAFYTYNYPKTAYKLTERKGKSTN